MTDLQLETALTETALTEAVDSLYSIDPAKWSDWIVFLLEALDNAHSARRDEYELMLNDVSEACCDRVERGFW